MNSSTTPPPQACADPGKRDGLGNARTLWAAIDHSRRHAVSVLHPVRHTGLPRDQPPLPPKLYSSPRHAGDVAQYDRTLRGTLLPLPFTVEEVELFHDYGSRFQVHLNWPATGSNRMSQDQVLVDARPTQIRAATSD